MDILVLNTDLDAISVVDTYESFIWTDRYRQPGDFELYMSMMLSVLQYIRQDYYIWNRDSEHVMIIEKIRIDSDVEDGNHINQSINSSSSNNLRSSRLAIS